MVAKTKSAEEGRKRGVAALTLIIAEKNLAARRIAAILSGGKARTVRRGRVAVYEFTRDGERYAVVGLRGHVVEMDYPKEMNSWDRVDLEDLAKAEPVKRVTERGIVNVIKSLAREADRIIIATDYDREGELIGAEAAEMIREVKPHVDIKRARFSAITPWDLKSAFENLTEIDENLARAAEARQRIDLSWGAVLTRFFSVATGRRGKDFLSVGRVQSPTLALIVEREKEILSFVPEKIFIVKADLQKGRVGFSAEHVSNPFREREVAERARERAASSGTARVLSFSSDVANLRPPPPLNTTEFLREANRLGVPPARAMAIAEELYMSGYISYPRTDNTVYPRGLDIKGILNRLKDTPLRKAVEYTVAHRRRVPTRGRREESDHPPIHPVMPAKEGELKGDAWKIYEFIVRRFLATLTEDATLEKKEARFGIGGERFVARGTRVVNPGWLSIYPYYTPQEESIPDLKEGDEVRVMDVRMTEDETKPPRRYSQGDLIKRMEDLNLGTKSTRHEIIQKLISRGYAYGNPLRPTKLGVALVEALQENDVSVVKPDMTARLEEDMARIAKGDIRMEDVVKESTDMLSEIIRDLKLKEEDIARFIREALREERVVGRCPRCGSELLVIRSKRGKFVGCSNYPECRFAFSIPSGGSIQRSERKCPACGSDMIVLRVRGRKQMRCIDPECKYNSAKDVLGTCPECGGEIVVRYGRTGKRFAGCSNYPECRVTYPLPQRGQIVPTGEKCEKCGAPVVIVRMRGKGKWKKCLNPECDESGSKSKASDRKG